MLKPSVPVKHFERQAARLLEQLLRKVPSLTVKSVSIEDASGGDAGIDITARVHVGAKEYHLICEAKQSGQPRFVRQAIQQMKAYLSRSRRDVTPILIAPFFTEGTRDICRAEGISFLDLEGNAQISFGPVYIERSTAGRPDGEKREFRSLFKPRSAQVLRVLLRDPKQVWKLSELADVSGVSIGHVSNVRNALKDREWLDDHRVGFRLKSPGQLLDAWQENYRIAKAEEQRLYTPLHGKTWEKALRDFFRASHSDGVALASFSSAQWIAPYGRISTQFLYAEPDAIPSLRDALSLSKATLGENVVLWLPNDVGVFTDTFETGDGIRCTSPLQTYLDLSQAGERGLEAAEHLRKAQMIWQS